MSEQLYKIEAISAMLDNDEKEIQGLAEMFIEFVPGMAQDLQNAIDAKDWLESGKQAHKIKSTVKIWQIDSILDEILFVEKNGKAGENTDEIIQQNQRVQEVLSAVVEQIRKDFKIA